MQNEKLQINLTEGCNKAEIILREGIANKELEPKAPVKTNLSGTINSVLEYLSKRLTAKQFEQKDCYIVVDRDKISIELIINESDEYRRGRVFGKLEYSPKFLEFGINEPYAWKPADLGMFIKMNRSYFQSREDNMKLVSCLMNYTAEINSKVEKAIAENGNRGDCFSQVVNSNLPASFNVFLPIFKGMPAESLEIETFAYVNGREITFQLLSPGAKSVLEDIRNKIIDEQLQAIKEIAPDIVIIEQ